MSNDNTISEKTQTNCTESSKKVPASSLMFNDADAETLFKSTAFVSPATYFSPKDKVSNMTWNNTLKCDEDRPVVTVYKSEDFGGIVRLN